MTWLSIIKKLRKNNLRELIREFLTHLHRLPNSEIQTHLKWLNLVEEEVQSAKARCLEVDRDFFSQWATEMKKVIYWKPYWIVMIKKSIRLLKGLI